jgi:homoserine O-acetyltransferase
MIAVHSRPGSVETPATTRRNARPHLRVVPAPVAEDGGLQTLELGAVDLERGGHLPTVTLAYRTWGTLNPAGDNAVLLLHALTGDSLAAGPGGWWEPLVGPGRPLDPATAFVLCANVLGGCAGSTGPATLNPETGQPWAMTFPLLTIGDIVATQRRLLDRLGVSGVTVIGGSIGGFQALEWATRHPDLVRGSLVIAAGGALSALGIATHSELGRRAIMADPAWQQGNYQTAGTFPAAGLAIARMAAMTTYHSRESLGRRFGRTAASRPGLYPAFGPTFDVEGYLHYHGAALVRRFDPNAYLYLTRAMDLYDVARDGGADHWLGRIAAPIDLVGISSDWLFPPAEIRALADHLAYLDRDVSYAELASPNGHDAFLKDWDQLTPLVAAFVARVARPERACPSHGRPP